VSPIHNGLFKQLPSEVQTLLLAECAPVVLKAGQLLGRLDTQDRVYFLSGATVALVVEEPDTKAWPWVCWAQTMRQVWGMWCKTHNPHRLQL
jgi:hypothetical protein